MEQVQMYRDGSLKLQSRPNMGFFYFVDMPLYSTINELRKACLYQKHRLDEIRQEGTVSEETINQLNKKLMNTTAILTDSNKREGYLNLLKIRAFTNQITNLDKIRSYQFSRVFPWMIFKVKVGKELHLLEVDILMGSVKLTSCNDYKVGLVIRSQEMNGSYDTFDSDTITLSYISSNGIAEYTFEPYYISQKETILRFIELFVDFDRLYTLNRKEIDWSSDSEWKPKKNTSDLSMHDGLILFEDDRIIPSMSGFKDVAEMLGKGVKVMVIVGPKFIIISKEDQVSNEKRTSDIIDLYVITQKSPKITLQEGIVLINEEDSPPVKLRFDNPAKGPTLIKAILDFQQANYSFQYECNTFPTISFQKNYEEYMKEAVDFIEKRNEKNNEEVNDAIEDEDSSDFEGYDYEY